jgi:hypothetical protein
MEPATTIVDVIEDFTGQELIPENLSLIKKMSVRELESLGDYIENEFTSQDYVRVPRPEPGMPVFAFGSFSRTSQVKPWMDEKRGAITDRVGELYAALTYLPAIAVPTELESVGKRNHLGKILGTGAIYRRRFIEELTFFSHVRGLVRRQIVILIPERFPLEGKSDDAGPLSMHVIKDLADLDHFKSVALDLSGAVMNDSTHAAIYALSQVQDLLRFCVSTGYEPAFDERSHQLAFDRLGQRPVKERASAPKIARLPRTNVLVPRFGKIPIDEFLIARDSDSFELFRNCISEVAKFATEGVSHSEIVTATNELLTEGRNRVAAEIEKSSILRKLIEGVHDFGLGIISSTLLGEANSAWASDPLKLLVSKSIESAVKTAAAIPKAVRKRTGLKATLRLFAAMLDEDQA